jgi:2-polyprenyl-3-methyl-5-hydroxy-6-metoxy-1,4-benzoquinol methylase
MNCLVCQHPTTDGPGYTRCPKCGFVKSLHPPKYDLDNYTKTYNSWYGTDLEIRINVNRVATVMKFVPFGKRVLDFGCSCGNFLSRLEQYPYACEGYEPSKTAPTNKTCKAVIHNDLSQVAGALDCITLFDVFEHFEDPEHMTKVLRQMLVKDGKLILITPDPDFRPDLENFYHLKPGEHVYLWNKLAQMFFMAKREFVMIHDEHSEGWIRRNANTEGYADNHRSLLTTVFTAN